jgi:thiol-disulfide isomerase/thioredoxin
MLPRFLQVYLIKFFAPWCGHCKVGGGAGPSTLRYCHHVPACVRVPSPCPSTFPPPARLLQRLAPTWDQLADHFKESQQVVIASVDCTEQKDICTKAEVGGRQVGWAA